MTVYLLPEQSLLTFSPYFDCAPSDGGGVCRLSIIYGAFPTRRYAARIKNVSCWMELVIPKPWCIDAGARFFSASPRRKNIAKDARAIPVLAAVGGGVFSIFRYTVSNFPTRASRIFIYNTQLHLVHNFLLRAKPRAALNQNQMNSARAIFTWFPRRPQTSLISFRYHPDQHLSSNQTVQGSLWALFRVRVLISPVLS